ncbi:NAD-dependent epimerase/dehydratase family protein [Pseudomonas paracarnis]|uniref:NAD-dependent epimerase/dehydratase family protein n=1 Tax=Pseudomonas paracarnis TaxID=2750625 RepID=UPI00249C3BB4|nr:NAD-dependent epimerase/dehydratase family protein [Pseudomonas paracarnis]MDI3184334.1 NAD-dependent epimerase/dehydratase family protein [Pseudomonas paracarnis]
MKKVLVTGANGFIGQAVCARLVHGGHSVRALVRSKPSGLAGVEYVAGDFGDPSLLEMALKNIDCVIHLAARVHQLNDVAKDPLAAFRAVNRDATINLARACLASGVKRFVFISSIGVNGAQTFDTPFNESSPAAPHAPYAVSKLEAEEQLTVLVGGTDMELVIIRPPLVYAGNAPGNFRRLLKLVSMGIPLPFGCVRNKRSMVSLNNLADFIGVCVVHPKAAHELFLISDGKDLSLPDILLRLGDGVLKKQKLLPVPVGFMMLAAGFLGKKAMLQQLCGSLVIDSSKSRRVLDWKAPEDTETALIKSGESYRKSLGL